AAKMMTAIRHAGAGPSFSRHSHHSWAAFGLLKGTAAEPRVRSRSHHAPTAAKSQRSPRRVRFTPTIANAYAAAEIPASITVSAAVGLHHMTFKSPMKF